MYITNVESNIFKLENILFIILYYSNILIIIYIKMLYNNTNMGIINKIALIGVAISTIIAPSIAMTQKITEYRRNNEDFLKPPRHNMDHWNSKEMPWDLFGDWSVPERYIGPSAINYIWDHNQGDFQGDEAWSDIDSHNLSDVMTSNYWEKDKNNYENYERENYHRIYKNNMNVDGQDGDEEFINGKWEDNSFKWIPQNYGIVSKTPMRGIIPFWEYTNGFNTYVLNETKNGTEDSKNLYYDEHYRSGINDYVSNNVAKTESPILYSYMENPDLITNSFDLKTNPEYKLPSDYQLVKKEYETDGTLKNAFLGGDIINQNWTYTSLISYLSDFFVWYWNNHGITDQDKKMGLKELEPGQVYVQIAIEVKDGWGWTNKYPYDTWNVKTEKYHKQEQFLIDGDSIGGEVVEKTKLGIVNFFYTDTPPTTTTGPSLEKTEQVEGIVLHEPIENSSKDGGLTHVNTVNYKWDRTVGAMSFFGVIENAYSMFDPLEKQMNTNSISKRNIDNETFDNINLNSFLNKKQYYQETKAQDVKRDVLNYLLTNDNGLNKQFIDYFSSDKVKIADYYANLSQDGKAFLNRNKFQTGFYPVEDIIPNDLLITLIDQDGNIVDDSTELGTIKELDLNIRPNDDSNNQKLFFNFTGEKTYKYDTTKLTSNKPVIPPVIPNGKSPIGIIMGVVVGVLAIVAAIIIITALVIKKKRKEKLL